MFIKIYLVTNTSLNIILFNSDFVDVDVGLSFLIKYIVNCGCKLFKIHVYIFEILYGYWVLAYGLLFWLLCSDIDDVLACM